MKPAVQVRAILWAASGLAETSQWDLLPFLTPRRSDGVSLLGDACWKPGEGNSHVPGFSCIGFGGSSHQPVRAVTALPLCPAFIWWPIMSSGGSSSYRVTHQELTWSLQQVGLLSTEA